MSEGAFWTDHLPSWFFLDTKRQFSSGFERQRYGFQVLHNPNSDGPAQDADFSGVINQVN